MGRKLSSKIILIILIAISWQQVESQIRPEVSFSGRYIPEYYFTGEYMTFPVAFELGGGVDFNNKWYIGTNMFYYGKKFYYDLIGYNYDFDYYQLELEFRRSFHTPFAPKLGIDLSFRPGLLRRTIRHDNTSDPMGTYFNYLEYPISLSVGLSYMLTDNIKFSVWPGVAWFANKYLWFNDMQVNYFCGTGISYKF